MPHILRPPLFDTGSYRVILDTYRDALIRQLYANNDSLYRIDRNHLTVPNRVSLEAHTVRDGNSARVKV